MVVEKRPFLRYRRRTGLAHHRRVSTVVVQRFCKPKVGGSNPSPGTNDCSLQLGTTFLDGTNVRAHRKAARAAGDAMLRHDEIVGKRLAGLVAGRHFRPASASTALTVPQPSCWRLDRSTSCRVRRRCSTGCLGCRGGLLLTRKPAATPSASIPETRAPGL